MTVKEVEKIIGKENMQRFFKWMAGQTVGMKNGETDYYDHDVAAFVNKLKTGIDRQGNPWLWD